MVEGDYSQQLLQNLIIQAVPEIEGFKSLNYLKLTRLQLIFRGICCIPPVFQKLDISMLKAIIKQVLDNFIPILSINQWMRQFTEGIKSKICILGVTKRALMEYSLRHFQNLVDYIKWRFSRKRLTAKNVPFSNTLGLKLTLSITVSDF